MLEDIQKFLKITNGSAEACLMIARNSAELAMVEQEIVNFGFKKAQGVREIFNSIKNAGKTYFTLTDAIGNNIYNILAQYPTGQVTAYDGQKNIVANPDYQKGSLLILVSKENLEKIEQGEKSLLKLAGLTWQK